MVQGHKEVISYEGNGVIFITEITPFLFLRRNLFRCRRGLHFLHQRFELVLSGKVDHANGGKVDIDLYTDMTARSVTVVDLNAADQRIDELRGQLTYLCELTKTFEQSMKVGAFLAFFPPMER